MFQFFHHSLMFTSLNQALLLPCLFSVWKRGRGKGRNEDGKGSGRLCKQERFSGCGAAHPEPDCATRIQTAQMTPSLGTFPRKQAFMEQRGGGDLPPWNEFLCSFCPEPCRDHTRAGLLCTPGAFSSSGCTQVAALARAVGWSTSWSWIPGLFCVSPYFSFPLYLPSFPSLPFNTSANSGFKVFCQDQASKTLWQICLGRAVFAPFSTSGKPCACAGVEKVSQ